MYCRKCGRQIKGNEKFCPYCGVPVDSDYTSVQGQKASSSSKETAVLVAVLCGLVTVIIVLVLVFFVFAGGKKDSEEKEEPVPTESRMESEPDKETEAFAESESETETESESETEPETEDNGIHRYTIHIEDVTWEEAQEACRDRGGKLLTLDTEEEYTYIKKMIKDAGYEKKILYLGGKRTGSSHDYYWLDKYGNSYGDILNGSSNWMAGEPSYGDATVHSEEYYMDFFYYGNESRWVWNDIPNDIISLVKTYSGKVGYICEYEE